jgi:hypothetical protein
MIGKEVVEEQPHSIEPSLVGDKLHLKTDIQDCHRFQPRVSYVEKEGGEEETDIGRNSFPEGLKVHFDDWIGVGPEEFALPGGEVPEAVEIEVYILLAGMVEQHIKNFPLKLKEELDVGVFQKAFWNVFKDEVATILWKNDIGGYFMFQNNVIGHPKLTSLLLAFQIEENIHCHCDEVNVLLHLNLA